MSYAGLPFWLFLAAVLAGVALLPPRLRTGWLIGASLLFYAAPEATNLLWLAGVVAVTVAALHGSRKGRNRVVRGGAIGVLTGLLFWAKFADTVGLPDPRAPPGLSFYVLTAIAILAEAAPRSGRRTLRDIAFHLVWFPKLLAGPIERPGTLLPQLDGLSLRPGPATLGFAFLLSGLVKKFVIAASLAPLVDTAFGVPEHVAPLDLWLATYAFAFQIYCDFSGYADIAIGLSALVGLRLSRNFDRPYLSTTVTEFWANRWHITLGHWFRDFVYIPLGGSRKGRLRRMANVMAVFLLSGLWHAGLGYGVGWTFLVWGMLNGAIVLAEGALPGPGRTMTRLFRGILTFHLILLGWVFFRAASLGDAWIILQRIALSLPDLPALAATYPLTPDIVRAILLVAALLVTEALCGPRPPAERLAAARLPIRWAGFYAAMAAILLCGRWQGAEFIYAGF